MSSRRFLVFLWILLAPVVALAAEAKLRALHLESSRLQKAVWLVEVMQGENQEMVYSRIYRREEGDPQWRLATILPAEVRDVTTYGGDLVALLHNGDWMIVGQSSGRRLPDNARLVALAGDERSLYALGELPASAPAHPDADPSASASEMMLYQLSRGQWERSASLPQEATSSLTLGVADGLPVLASLAEQTLSLWQLRGGSWQLLGSTEIATGEPARLFEEAGRLFIFLSGDDGAQILARDTRWLAPVHLPTQARVFTLGLAGGQLRFVYGTDEGVVKERRISPRTLEVSSADVEVALPEPLQVESVHRYVHWTMMGIIALVMIHTYRKREEYRNVQIDWSRVQLAPFGRRFFAGMIDLLPVILAMLYARMNVAGVETVSDIVQSAAASEVIASAILIYLLHTTITEAIFGRSIGKMITHLQVVNMQGKRPGIASLLIRNVLRVVDIVLWFTLILMVYLPLRQRLGDLAGGTVVVVDREHAPGPQ